MTSANTYATDLEDGDLLVGAIHVLDNFGSYKGIIVRVRNGEATTYCESPPEGWQELFWADAHHVIINSNGDVIFLASMQPWNYSGSSWGLFRCSGMGNPPELLARFPIGEESNPNFFYPFPGETFYRTSGLHLAKSVGVAIDDDVNGGTPSVDLGEDAYVFALGSDTPDGLSVRTVRYLVGADRWEDGPTAVTWWSTSNPPPYDHPPHMPDMISGGGATYSVTNNLIGELSEPLRLDASGSIGGVPFSLQASLFGGFSVVPEGITIDDIAIPNVQGCNPEDCPPPFNMMPWNPNFVPLSGLTGVAYDGKPYVTPGTPGSLMAIDNLDAVFQGGDETFWCNNALSCGVLLRKIQVSEVMPFWDPDTGEGNGVESLVYAKGHGLVGTQWQTGRVLRVSGTRMVPVITGLANPRGIAGYPSVVGTSGLVISIRMDATGSAELSDANGRRLGTDLSTLDPLNDFDIDGSDTGAGEVRFLAIKNARPGPYCLQTLDDGGNDYAVNVYSSLLEPGPGRRLRRTVSSGSIRRQRFVLFENGTIRWQPLPSQTDLDADTDVDLVDATLMLGCLTGPGDSGAPTPAPPGCQLSVGADGLLPADFDEDRDVDLWDIAGLQRGFSGTDIPAPTTCVP